MSLQCVHAVFLSFFPPVLEHATRNGDRTHTHTHTKGIRSIDVEKYTRAERKTTFPARFIFPEVWRLFSMQSDSGRTPICRLLLWSSTDSSHQRRLATLRAKLRDWESLTHHSEAKNVLACPSKETLIA